MSERQWWDNLPKWEEFENSVAQSPSRTEEPQVSSGAPTPDAARRMADRLRHHRCEPGLLELHEEAARMLEELALVKLDADCLRIERDNLSRGLVRALAGEAETIKATLAERDRLRAALETVQLWLLTGHPIENARNYNATFVAANNLVCAVLAGEDET